MSDPKAPSALPSDSHQDPASAAIRSALVKYANEARKHFSSQLRRGSDSPIITLSHDAPPWVRNLVYEAHNVADMPPNDWRMDMILRALNAVADGTDEIEPPTYQNELADWLGSLACRVGYFDDYTAPKHFAILECIQWAWSNEMDEIMLSVQSSLSEQ